MPRLQLLGGGHIGQDHEFLNQPMTVEPRTRRDRCHVARFVQHDPTFREIEIERAPRLPRFQERPEGAVERGKRQSQVVPLVRRTLHLFVCQSGRTAHQAPPESMR